MKSFDKIRSFYTVANIAALPATGQLGWVYNVLDDGTGKPAIAIWDSAAVSWGVVSIGSGGGGSGKWENPVESKAVTDPSTLTPSAGERWIVAVGGVGLWSGKDNDIAEWDGANWDFTTPTEGSTCEVLDEDQYYVFNGTVWINAANFLLHSSLTGLGNDDHTQYHNNTRGDARYYTETELDAAPVTAGAKIDKIIGTDTAIVISDGIVGAVKDTGVLIDASNNMTTPGNITLSKAGSNTNSKEVILEANTAGASTIGAIQVLFGADPYLRISVPDNAGAKTAVLDIHDTLIALSSDNAVDLGAVASGRLKDIFAAGNIVGANLSGTNTGDEIAATESVAGIAEIATQGEMDAGTDDTRFITPKKYADTPTKHITVTSIDNTDSPYTVLDVDDVIAADAVGGTTTINLPDATTNKGHHLTIKRMNAGANKVTIDAGIQTIDGSSTVDLNSQFTTLTMVSDGSNWLDI